MRWSRLNTFFKSSTARLAGTYLIIIMAMSIGFSLVLYHTSSQALGRQLPPDSFFHAQTQTQISGQQPSGEAGSASGSTTLQGGQASRPEINDFLRKRISEGRSALMTKLVILNVGALVVGSVLSYVLARRSLQPIEAAMEAQVRFVSDASHELRTPLTAIQASNEVFLRKPKVTMTQARQLIEQNTEDIVRLKQLSDSLLTLSAQGAKQTATFIPVSVHDIVGDALTQVVEQATQKNITLNDELKDMYVLGNPAALVQVLVILLDNAVKYSNQDGTISLSGSVSGKQARLQITDEGIGIRASDLPHLFRRFYRADNARTGGERGGYGLGLAIAQKIVEGHQGQITAESTPGKGSTFTLVLPVATPVQT